MHRVEHIEKIAVDNVWDSFSPAVSGKLVLGENHVGAVGHTEIRTSVADVEMWAASLENGTFANASGDTAVWPGVGEIEVKAGFRLNETIGYDPDAGDTVDSEDPLYKIVDPITHDYQLNPMAVAELFEILEPWVNFHLFKKRVYLLATSLDEADLRLHAFRGIDQTRFPARLDVPPLRKGKALKHKVGYIISNNGTVKVAEKSHCRVTGL